MTVDYKRIPVVLLAASACACSHRAQPQPLVAGFGLTENQNFCTNGVFSPSTITGKPTVLNAWGSYCDMGDNNTGRVVTSSFLAPDPLALYLAGYPSEAGLTLQLERLRDGSRLSLKPQQNPGESWQRYEFTVPPDWSDTPVRLVAEDRATGWGGWLAFSEPLKPQTPFELRRTGTLLWRTAWHFLLTMVPCFTLCTFAAWRGVRDPIVLGALALVGIGLTGYLSFWAWFLSRHSGRLVSELLVVSGLCALIWLTPKLTPVARANLMRLLAPALLVFCASMMVIAAGFLYGGMDMAMATPRARFSHQLMGDNMLPFIFAEQVATGHVQKPIQADWHSSDRPPLQTGMVLAQWPFVSHPRDLGYTALGALLQSLWIFALWLLLIAFDLDRRPISLALAVPLFSGFVFLNTFFVWPKLFAAAFMIAFSALILPPGAVDRLSRSASSAIVAGALLAFGMLAHGSSAFAVIGVVVVALILRINIPLRRVLLIGCVCGLLYFPWILYQKLFDPPGDRLLKFHLAGVTEVDSQTFFQALRMSYAHLSFSDLVHNREANAAVLFDHLREYWSTLAALVPELLHGASNHSQVVQHFGHLRVLMFFYFMPALGFLMLGPLALVVGLGKGRLSPEWRAAFRFIDICYLHVVFLLLSNVSSSLYGDSPRELCGRVASFRRIDSSLLVGFPLARVCGGILTDRTEFSDLWHLYARVCSAWRAH